MPRKPIEFDLDFMVKDIFSRFAIKQFDDVSFNIKPMNQGKPYDTTNMIGKIFVGVNNDMFMQDTNITVSSNNINVLLDKNMLQKQGRAYAEIELTDENGTITSSSFVFDIEPKIGEGATIPGEYEGFVAKYERLVSKFKGQVNNAILDSNNRTTNTIAKFNTNSSNALNVFNANANNKLVDVEKRFQTLTASKQQDAEVIDSRDGEISLKARLDRDLAKGKIINENVEGTYITVNDSVGGSISNIEILGNTTQDTVDLKDIKSVGTLREDGLYKMSILSTGKNLNSTLFEVGRISITTGGDYGISGIRSKGYNKIKPNTKYINSINGVPKSYNNIFYDINKNFISYITASSYTTPANAYYVRFDSGDTDINVKVQLEEGIVTTTYEPYQYNKSSILLPCQLEKVGDVADRLFRREDGVWCIEKNIGEVVLNGSESWNKSTTFSNEKYLTYYSNILNRAASRNVLCNRFKTETSDFSLNGEKIWGASHDDNVFLMIDISKLTTSQDLAGFKTWLSQNSTLVKYQLSTPQIIELPLDTQIQLNSFAGITNIFTEDTVIEPTIKAIVPKSLGASMQSLNNKTDNLSQRVENVEKLKEGQELEVISDKGYVVVENTNNGYIEDFKVEGNTLVNLCVNKIPNSRWQVFSSMSIVDGRLTTTSSTTVPNVIISNDRIFKADTTLTIGIKIKVTTSNINKITLRYRDADNNVRLELSDIISPIANNEYYKILKFTIPTDSSVNAGLQVLYNYTNGDNAIGVYYDIYDLLILEGDHTQNPPSYFEGLKSVGDGVDKIEVLSQDNKGNLFDGQLEVGSYKVSTGLKDVNSNMIRCISPIRVKPNTTYNITNHTNNTYIYVLSYDINNNLIKYEGARTQTFTLTTSSNTHYLCFYMLNDKTTNGNASVEDEVQIIQNNVMRDYTPIIQNKKQILYKTKEGVWEKPVLRSTGGVADTIEKHSDGKYYFHKRCGEVVLNGSENIVNMVLTAEGLSDFMAFEFTEKCTDGKRYSSTVVSSDFCKDNRGFSNSTLHTVNGNSVKGRAISFHTNNNLYLRIEKSVLSTQDVAGFKTWLSQNNVTVVYQLATEEVYECVNLDLDSYEGETSVIIDSGAIPPKLTFKIASHIANTISVLKDRINYLEDKVIGMFKAVLAGDVQTLAYELYPQDFEKEEDIETTEKIEGTELL